ncbi:DUF3035 domain-containing protein [Roseomonas elaeocarpi]|uniref:DUF3035 domain-containing protein n=1 Tax=Roseomonas elaeocarpi TaxID=907779 RepID=A0ABV6JQ02_9PROT
MRKRLPIAALVIPAMVPLGLLTACGGDTARTLGFTRDAPDEFQVVTRAPLSVPPDMNNLPVPRPGATRPQELSARQQAESTLVPTAALGRGQAPARQSSGESALVAQATGGAPVSSDIRRQVDEESLRVNRPSQTLVDRLMFWRDPPAPGVAVDPQRESQRIRENAALGRPETQGDTPIIQRKERGIFDGLF